MNRRTTTGNELTIARWKDKKPAYVASNCDSSESQASEEGFYQQNNKSMLKLGMTGLTITRVVSRSCGHCGQNTQKGFSKCGAGLHDHCF